MTVLYILYIINILCLGTINQYIQSISNLNLIAAHLHMMPCHKTTMKHTKSPKAIYFEKINFDPFYQIICADLILSQNIDLLPYILSQPQTFFGGRPSKMDLSKRLCVMNVLSSLGHLLSDPVKTFQILAPYPLAPRKLHYFFGFQDFV